MNNLLRKLKEKNVTKYQILIVHAVYVWSDDGEIFHALRRRRVGHVNRHLHTR